MRTSFNLSLKQAEFCERIGDAILRYADTPKITSAEWAMLGVILRAAVAGVRREANIPADGPLSERARAQNDNDA